MIFSNCAGDFNSGSEKKDMTRAGEIKRLFRVIINRCGLLKIPVIITNHTYKNVGSFISSDVVGGGATTVEAPPYVIPSAPPPKEGNDGNKANAAPKRGWFSFGSKK